VRLTLAVALAATAVLAASCGGSKPAASAAEVAPAGTYLLIEGRPTAELERALAFLPESAELERLLARAIRLTGAGNRPTLAVLDRAGTRAVALVRSGDRKQLDKQLDDAGIAHARVSGWTVFARDRASVDAVRHAKRRLAATRWFHPVDGDVSFNRRLGTVVASARGDQATATRTEPAQGADAEHPLAAAIPADAVAAAAVHDGATVFGSLPFAGELKKGLGLETATLAAAAPGDAVLYARSGVPAAGVTLLASGTDLAAARRVVAELAPNVPGVPGAVGGVAATDVSLGPVDLFYGKVGRTIFVTDDPGATLEPQASSLEPEGLPAENRAWAYLDVAHGLPALESLAALAGTRLSPAFIGRLSSLHTLLAYRTRGALTVAVR
jgi:hypothetical protein